MIASIKPRSSAFLVSLCLRSRFEAARASLAEGSRGKREEKEEGQGSSKGGEREENGKRGLPSLSLSLLSPSCSFELARRSLSAAEAS